MIKLSKRLETIASFIDENDDVLDIGCDHALLDIYLSKKYSKIYYASDLRESALDMARSNIKKYDADKVILKCGNGLEVIDESNKINTIIISGMGYLSITNILRNIRYKKEIKKVVIQSNSNPEIVRKFMIKNGFYIDKELLVKDKNIFYVVSSYKRGKRKYNSVDKEVGIMAGSILNDYIDIELKKNAILLKVIPKKHFYRRMQVKRKINLLKKRILNK